MSNPEHRKLLQELIKKEDLNNKICVDCSNPNPQWASLSFAVFLCLQCAGTHRGFGVHISFVRSVSMDKWEDEQIRRMQLGGNAPFRQFMKSYAPTTSGYHEGQSSYDTYHCWAATQYREKLDATLAGKEWSPSAPPEGTENPSRPSSAQGLRKSRASARSATGSSLRNDSSSPAQFRDSPTGSSNPDQKAANESYFASLGQANASRPDNLPPSQGGKYQGFGSTPPPNQHPSYGMSSANAPSFNELQENPMAALSKGWSLLSSAVAGASKVVNENVIQPGLERYNDPNFQASVKGYMTEAQRRAAAVGTSANQWSKDSLGVDVADRVGGAYGDVKDRFAGPQKSGYGSLSTEHDEQTSALYHDDDDFFDSFNNPNVSGAQGQGSSHTAPAAAAKKKDDWDDDWKDF